MQNGISMNEINKILLIEDNPADARLIREMLVESGLDFELEHATNLTEGQELISKKGADVILLDLGLSDSHGFETFLEMRDYASTIPIVIFTGFDDEELRIMSVKEHAQDYLVKGEINSRMIKQSIRYAIERKQVEEKLKESEERFRATIDSSGAGYFFIDMQGRIQRVNRAWLEMHGYKNEEEVRGQHFSITQVDDDLEQATQNVELLFSGQPIHSGEFSRRNKDGTIGWHTFTAKAVYSGDEVVGIEGFLIDVTDRRRAEAEREQYYNFFQSSTDLMAIADPNGAFLKTNPACSQVLGYSEAELLAQPFVEFVHPDDKKGTLDEMARQQKIGSSFNFENRYVCKDGSIRWLSWRATYNKDEGVTYATARDVTDLKLVEEALRESEERLRITLEETKIAIWDWDIINDVWYASPTYYTMLGYEPVTGPADRNEWLERAYPADRDYVTEKIRGVLKGTASKYQYEARVRHADGSYRWQSTLGHTIAWDQDGKPARLIGVRIDIEEHKQAELALAASETKLRAIFEQSRDAIGVTKAGILIMVNPAYVELFRYADEAELIGASVLTLTAADERDRVMQKVRTHEGTERAPEIYQTRGLKKDGSEFDMEVSVSAYELDRETYTLVILRDISERVIMEESLRQAQKMESVGRLAGGVAHDFNNFLTAVEGYIDLTLIELPEEGAERKNLLEARHAAERAANLTRQLLLFSRREPLELKPINLGMVVRDLLKMLERILGEQYAITVSLEEDLPPVRADRGQLDQVLMNLIVNARDAMAGGGDILITTEKVMVDDTYVQSQTGAQPGDFVRLSVCDAGTGMDEDTLSHIFDPFFSTKGAGTGTGLGLSVAYGIVTQHGGWIEAKSRPGIGSTFSIYLPEVPAGTGDADLKTVLVSEPRGSGQNILLVEDEESVRQLAEEMLKSHGYNIFSAANAEEALRIFEEKDRTFQLVFSDVILPGMDGIGLIERLTEQQPGLRIMLASGFVEGKTLKIIRDKGYRFLEKPYDLSELLLQVGELLSLD